MGKHLTDSGLKGFQGVTHSHIERVFTRCRVSHSHTPCPPAPLLKTDRQHPYSHGTGSRGMETTATKTPHTSDRSHSLS